MKLRAKHILFAVSAAVLSACDPPATEAPRPARQLMVAVDLSGSQTPQSLLESRELIEKLVDDLSFGDRMVLMEMNRVGVRGQLKRYVDSVPALADPTFVSSMDEDNLDGARQSLKSLVPLLFDSTLVGKVAHTDIFSTLHTVSEYVRESGGRPATLVLLSDMLQSANDVEMEGLRRMPSSDWIRQQEARGIIPDLPGVCVVVVGADDTTSDGVAVKQFWTEYMTAAGAVLRDENYRLLATQASGLECGSAAGDAPPT